jgi:hypothetical protein
MAVLVSLDEGWAKPFGGPHILLFQEDILEAEFVLVAILVYPCNHV